MRDMRTDDGNAVSFFVFLLAGIVLGTVLASQAFARPTPPLTFDENGHGTTGAGYLADDPGPGGLPSVLTYPLPFVGVQGDVALRDPNGQILDVIRFNGDSTLIFYSDNLGGFDAKADTPGPPGTPYTNLVTIPELGPEGANTATYEPTAGQPGFDDSFPTYVFISDSPRSPAPAMSHMALAVLGAALLAAGAYVQRRTTQS